MIHPRRPVFLNLLQIQLPLGALTSIGHRITGVLLGVCVPIGVYMLDRSLRDEQGFVEMVGMFKYFTVKAVTLLVVWALAHHVLSGIRHLLSDANVAAPLRSARRSAWFANLGGVALTAVAAGLLL